MQVLEGLGIPTSIDMIPKHAANKYGSKEDKEIFRIQTELQRELGSLPQLPLPEGWLNHPKTRDARNKLVGLIKNYSKTHKVFAFKDPKTNSFLPLWNQIFNQLRVVPVYIYASREYSATAASFKRQYNTSERDIEATWLCRTLDGLHNCGLDCHIVHYEDWLTKPDDTLSSFQSYLESFGIKTSSVDIATMLDVNANHVVTDKIKTSNQLINDIESALSECRGSSFNRQALAEIIAHGRRKIKDFESWSSLAHQSIQAKNKLAKQVDVLQNRVRELEINERKVKEFARLDEELKESLGDLERITLL